MEFLIAIALWFILSIPIALCVASVIYYGTKE